MFKKLGTKKELNKNSYYRNAQQTDKDFHVCSNLCGDADQGLHLNPREANLQPSSVRPPGFLAPYSG